MAPVTQVRPARVTQEVALRKDISLLSADELAAYRAAVDTMKARPDDRGWQFYAGWHGVPNGWCEHNTLLFLPWHRSYLYHFELALKDAAGDPAMTVPWWDWVTQPGLPAAFTDGDAADGSANPLLGAEIRPFGIAPDAGLPPVTSRLLGGNPGPGPRPLPPPLAGRYEWLMEPDDYGEFSRRMEILHGNVHGWVGGTMAFFATSAFDPVFFSHHSMVDRLWRIWQVDNPGGQPSPDDLDRRLQAGKQPLFTVRELLDVQTLGYDYAATAAAVGGTL